MSDVDYSPSLFNYAFGAPVISGVIRSCAEDFQVDEELGFEPDDQGEHYLIQIRKRNTNTEWLARQLAKFLGREPHFVTLAWKDQLPALEEGKIDIIMSGMTITPKRAYRVAFAKPYMRSGQMLLVRMKEAQRYSSGIYSLMGNKPAIGTIKDTTGDFFITKTISLL